MISLLKEQIELKLSKNLPSEFFLSKMRVVDENLRKSSSYTDPKYLPFYGWLGTLVFPKSLLEIGFGLGLSSGCFLSTCKSVNNFLAFQEDFKDFSPKLGISNIKDNYRKKFYLHVGNIYDDIYEKKLAENLWELALINCESSYDRYREYFDIVWLNLMNEGLIFIDNIFKNRFCLSALKDFCKIRNRDFIEINTRYGIGVIQK